MQIVVAKYTVEVEIKQVKHLRLSVYPAQNRIHVSAPPNYDIELIRSSITQKLPWIDKHFARFAQRPKQVELSYISGETHFLEGKPFQLNVISNASVNKICIREDRYIDLYETPGRPEWQRPLRMQDWYEIRLKVRCEPLLAKWQQIIGVSINAWGIKQMKTRWGSCNIRAKRIWLRLELAKRSDESLEFVIVHELTHLLEKGHNARFYAFMDEFLPDWRLRKAKLNSSISIP